MSCWHFTAVLRIPALALGFKYLREWNEFLEKHEDDFRREEDCFCESLSEDFPLLFSWGETINRYTDRKLDQRDPEHPDIVPGPFLDYYLRDDYLSVNQAESQVACGILRTGILRMDPPL